MEDGSGEGSALGEDRWWSTDGVVEEVDDDVCGGRRSREGGDATEGSEGIQGRPKLGLGHDSSVRRQIDIDVGQTEILDKGNGTIFFPAPISPSKIWDVVVGPKCGDESEVDARRVGKTIEDPFQIPVLVSAIANFDVVGHGGDAATLRKAKGEAAPTSCDVGVRWRRKS